MVDVSEQIVKEYLKLSKNQFTIENIRFKVPNNYSDIDILAVDKEGNFHSYEVKWRHKSFVGATKKETIPELINQILRPERLDKIKKIIGNKRCNHVFVCTHWLFNKNEKKREDVEKQFKDKGIKIEYFEDMIKKIIQKVKEQGWYDSPILQTIRMLKCFDLVKAYE